MLRDNRADVRGVDAVGVGGDQERSRKDVFIYLPADGHIHVEKKR